MNSTDHRSMQGPATEKHARHMESLKGMRSAAARAEYIEGVRRSEGKFAAKWLQDDFATWWANGRTTA